MEEPSERRGGCPPEQALGQRLFLMEDEVLAEGEIDEHASRCAEEKSNNGVMACQGPEAKKSQYDATVYDEAGKIGQHEAAPLMMYFVAFSAAVPERPVTIQNPVIT